jgi:diguanylate cyclase (GGDEF)-like protein
MTIRKKILLFSALALGAFLAAVYLVSRFALLNGFARLESEAAEHEIHHLQSGLKNEESSLQVMARDYAQWDETYEFMETRDPIYARKELTNDTFKIIRTNFFALFDGDGRPVLHKSLGEWEPTDQDLQDIAAIAGKKRNSDQTVAAATGVLELQGRIVLLATEPILNSKGSGKPRGVLVMGRLLDDSVLASIGHATGFSVWLEPPSNLAEPTARGLIYSDGDNSARIESDATTLEYIAIRDFSGASRRLLVGRTPRSLFQEGKAETRYLWGLLMLAGAVFCGALFFFVDKVLMDRITSLSRDVAKVTISGDLSLRLDPGGNDELSALARTVNTMLSVIQRAKSDLLEAQESLRFHAEHDALTGVLNRRAIRDVLRKELARCRREGTTFGVLLADVDHFKKINDHFGHAAGDAVLVTVVQRISAVLRSYDAVGRYGGEEFLIIAPGCDLELAQKLAERISSAISDEAVDLGDHVAPVSVSVGVTLGTSASDPEFLVEQADTAMYQAKRQGRNRVETCLELPAATLSE